MNQYLLSTYSVDGDVSGGPATPEEMQAFMERVIALEAEMDEGGAFVFGGALDGPDAATVVDTSDGEVTTTEGPFAAARERIAGFYIINAEDLDAAIVWAGKTAVATNHSIEVRPFRATGRVADHVRKMSEG